VAAIAAINDDLRTIGNCQGLRNDEVCRTGAAKGQGAAAARDQLADSRLEVRVIARDRKCQRRGTPYRLLGRTTRRGATRGHDEQTTHDRHRQHSPAEGETTRKHSCALVFLDALSCRIDASLPTSQPQSFLAVAWVPVVQDRWPVSSVRRELRPV